MGAICKDKSPMSHPSLDTVFDEGYLWLQTSWLMAGSGKEQSLGEQ